MKYLFIITILILTSSVYAGTDKHTQLSTENADRTTVASMKGWNINVENTPKAKLRSAMDIIEQISQVHNVLGKLYVEGRDEAEVYINNRKLNQLTELWHTPASLVSSISIITSPGALYGKDVQAVIVVYVKEVEDNGLRLTKFMRLDADTKVKPNNELTLGYRKGALNIGSFLAWNETYSETLTNGFTYYYDSADKLTRTTLTESKSMNHNKQLTAKASIDYDISKLHHISASYTFERNPYVTSVSYMTNSYDSIPDNDAPTSHTMEPGSRNVNGKSRHIVNAEYHGMMGRWKLTLGNNTQWEDIKTFTYPDLGPHKDYLVSECKTRSYLNANGLVGLGDVDAGIEFLTDNSDILYNPHRTNEKNGIWFLTHTHNRDNTLALYASTTQKWRQWTMIAGLRFENVLFTYIPYENDGALLYLDYLSHLFGAIQDQYKYIDLHTLGRFIYRSHYFYPNVSVSTKIGDSQLALSYAVSSSKPYITLSMIKKSDISTPLSNAKHLLEEHISTTTLKWSMAWLTTTLSHRYHSDPLFSTTRSSLKYNWDAYNEVDAGITLSPTIHCWQPSLMVNVHKQWLDLYSANNDNGLSRPLVTANWTNSVTLPYMWMARINASWHSRGADRNIYYYSYNLNLDLSLQKSFAKPRLTFEISANNILRQSYDDVTIFNANNIGVSEGYRIRKPRIVSLSAKWEM